MKKKQKLMYRLISLLVLLCTAVILLSTAAFAGVTDVTGGSNTIVETSVEEVFSAKGSITYQETGETIYFKDAKDGVELASDDPSELTAWLRSHRVSEAYEKIYTGSKLTYTGTTYDSNDPIIGDPDDIFASTSPGKVTIHEIRTDYYLYSAEVNIPVGRPEAIDTVDLTGATLTYQPCESPKATAALSGKFATSYDIVYERWEEMEKRGSTYEPVAFWYSDESQYTKATPKFDTFKADTTYFYSIMLQAKDGCKFSDSVAMTLNGEAVTGGMVSVYQDGATCMGDAIKTLTPKAPATEPTPTPAPEPTPTPAPAPEPEPALPFRDISDTDWYYNDVSYVYNAGLMRGTDDDIFSPATDITRGMLLTILYRQAGTPSVSGPCPFTDVPKSYYTDAITWGAEAGIALGYGNQRFGPADPITRQQLAAMLYRYAAYCGLDVSGREDLSSFSDASDIAAYASAPMAWSVRCGILRGHTSGLLKPNGHATRAEAAAMLHRFCDFLGNIPR